MIPTQLLMIPTYIMFSRLGLVDTLARGDRPVAGDRLRHLPDAAVLPVAAGRARGGGARSTAARRSAVFWRIVLPLAKPALATLPIFTLLGSWNDLIWPLIAINDEHCYTLQLGLANFQGTRRTEWSLLMAGNVVATMPLILFFLVAQKHFIATMTFSGLKG